MQLCIYTFIMISYLPSFCNKKYNIIRNLVVDKNVVYLTKSVPYALLYIWDKEHNIKSGKYVTGYVKDGTV